MLHVTYNIVIHTQKLSKKREKKRVEGRKEERMIFA